MSEQQSVDLGRLSLREKDRALVLGGSGSGKSALANVLLVDFAQRYDAKKCRVLVVDSKPRYRVAYTVQGVPAKRRYRSWSHGTTIPGSCLVEDPRDLDLAWQLGHRVAVVQAEQGARTVPRLVAVAAKFLQGSKASRPQLLYVDEYLDFFHSNGQPRGGTDVLVRVPRAGRERGTASLFGAQRTKGFPTSALEEMNRCYEFRMDYQPDRKRLAEFGMPEHTAPTRDHAFYFWTKLDRRQVYGPYKLALPSWAA